MSRFFCREKTVNEKFLVAVGKGDSVLVREYLATNSPQAILQAIDKQGRNALMLVCSKGKLIQYELVANQLLGHTNLFELNRIDHNGNTALNLAAIHKKKVLFEALWNNPATDINLANKKSHSPSLCYSLLNPILLHSRKHDIDLSVKDRKGKSLFFLSVEHGRFDLVETLLKLFPNKIDVNDKDIHGNNALMSMILNEEFLKPHHVEMVKLLLSKGLDRSALNKRGHTIEHILLHKKYDYFPQGPTDERPDLRAIELKNGILREMFDMHDYQSPLMQI